MIIFDSRQEIQKLRILNAVQSFWLLSSLLLSSLVIIGFVFFPLPQVFLQQIIAICILLLFVLLYRKYRTLGQMRKWLLLFTMSFLTQLVVISTGGFQSPFFMLLPFFILGMSFLFNFLASMLFLMLAVFSIFVQGTNQGTLAMLFASEPATLILIWISLFLTMPVAYELAYRYKLKDVLTQLLVKKLEVEEAILSEILELLFITDPMGVLLSINDAASVALKLSPEKVMHHNVFDILSFKDEHDTILTEYSIGFTKLVKEKKTIRLPNLQIGASSLSLRGTLIIKPITNGEGSIMQVAFIFQQE